MGIRQDQCNKVCRIIDDYLANRPRERDELIVAVRTVFKEADRKTEPQIYGNEHNCIMTLFGDCSYTETGCGSCEVVEKVRKALDKYEPKREATISKMEQVDEPQTERSE